MSIRRSLPRVALTLLLAIMAAWAIFHREQINLATLDAWLATLGPTLAFLVARYVAGDWVARRAGGLLKRLIDGVDAEGWRFVAFVRLVPLFPFNLSNYLLGLTRIPFH